jgi:hypothetical protein
VLFPEVKSLRCVKPKGHKKGHVTCLGYHPEEEVSEWAEWYDNQGKIYTWIEWKTEKGLQVEFVFFIIVILLVILTLVVWWVRTDPDEDLVYNQFVDPDNEKVDE